MTRVHVTPSSPSVSSSGSSSTSVTELGTILSIWAHPDDETYLAAGVMAAARDLGQRVVCIVATAGELGTDDPATWPPQRLARVRRWEASAAMAVLGVDEHRIIGLPDGGLRDDDESMIERMVSLVDEIRPDTILTFGPDGMTFHPDHVAVHHWVTEAWHRTGASARLLYATTSAEFLRRYRELFEEWGMYMTDDRPVGVPEAAVDVHLHLDGAELDRKLTALRAMATQTGGLIAAVGDEMYATQVAQEWFVDARTLMAAAGRQAVAVSSSSSPR